MRKTKLKPGGLCSTILLCLRVTFLAIVFLLCEQVTVEATTKETDARQAMATAEALRAKWTEASLQQAIEHFDKAAQAWTTGREFSNASEAALKSGDVYFLLSKYPEALRQYKTAVVLAGKTGDRFAEGRALGRIGRLYSYTGDNDLAQKQLEKALNLLEFVEPNPSAAHKDAYAEALSDLAEVTYSKGYLSKSLKQFETALTLFQDDPAGKAKAHLFAGYINGSLGQPEKAFAEISKAQELYRSVNDRLGEGLTLTALGLFHSLKSKDLARQLHQQALDIFRSIGDRHSEAVALTGLGLSYEKLDEQPTALAHYESAANLLRTIGALGSLPVATCKVAKIHHLTAKYDEALAYYERCVQLSRAAGKRRTEVNALNEIAGVYVSQGDYERALQQYRIVHQFYRATGDLRGQATALNTYGDFLFNHDGKQQALEAYREALSFSEKAGDSTTLLTIRYNVARTYLHLGAYQKAMSVINESLNIIEDLRTNVGSPDFRASYFSGVQKHYTLGVDTLMRLHREQPGHGFAVQALLLNEKGRARSLVDLISESRRSLHEGAPAPLLQRDRELRALIRSLSQYQWDLSLNKNHASEMAEVAKEIAQRRSEYQEVQSQLRTQNPNGFSVEQFVPLSLEQIQKELLDSNTMLLEYGLGDERSFLWAVTSNSFHSYELPARKTINDAASEFYKLLTALQDSDGQTASEYQTNIEQAEALFFQKGTSLFKMLLGSVAEQLGNRRLIVVSEGALQLVPFETLLVPLPPIGPGEGETLSTRFLIETNEIVGSPSISTLAAIRYVKHKPVSPERIVAVIADPVLSPNDERVQRGGSSPVITSAAADPNSAEPPQPAIEALRRSGAVRLLHTSEEADAISAAAPRGTAMIAKGFDASRETAMSPHVGQYQILHFATHGFLDGTHPELSGIVLTMVDRNGVEKNGLLPLYDIHNLDLAAELTVLSACQTALGKDVRGEGLIGLAHSFMSAGAKSVVASLWKVDDRATAVLMEDFYKAMLQEGQTPAAALRSAKLKMMQDKKWSAPYYWAGFVLQGEYTNRISIDRQSQFPFGLVLLSLFILITLGLLTFMRKLRAPSRKT